MRLRPLPLLLLLAVLPVPVLTAQPATGEVRQIVTFLFQPGGLEQALPVYARALRPIYTDLAALRRLTGYREVESSEPLDLIIVSHYGSMAGMDSANAALRLPHASRPSALALYGTLSRLTQHHHDQFVEMRPALSDTLPTNTLLTVFEYVRLVPGGHARYEASLRESLRPLERRAAHTLGSETGRLLVSDGWDYLRLHAVRTLADWHNYQRAVWDAPAAARNAALVSARKVIIVRRDTTIGVR